MAKEKIVEAYVPEDSPKLAPLGSVSSQEVQDIPVYLGIDMGKPKKQPVSRPKDTEDQKKDTSDKETKDESSKEKSEKKEAAVPKKKQVKKADPKKKASEKKTAFTIKHESSSEKPTKSVVKDIVDVPAKETPKKVVEEKKPSQKEDLPNPSKKFPSDKRKKKEPRKVLPWIVNIIIVVVLLLIIIWVALMGHSYETVATVNGIAITEEDVSITLLGLPANTAIYASQEQILNQTILNQVLLQEADKKGLVPSGKDVKEFIEISLEAEGTTEDEFNAYLDQNNITRKDVEKLYSQQLAISALVDSLDFALEVTAKDVREFHRNNPEMFEGVGFNDVAADIAIFLEEQATRDAFEVYAKDLLKQAEIVRYENGKPLISFSKEQEIARIACAAKFQIPQDTLLYVYTNGCPQCDDMSKIIAQLSLEGTNIAWLDLSETNSKKIIKECYADVVENAVPMSICSDNGNILVGEHSITQMRELISSC